MERQSLFRYWMGHWSIAECYTHAYISIHTLFHTTLLAAMFMGGLRKAEDLGETHTHSSCISLGFQ